MSNYKIQLNLARYRRIRLKPKGKNRRQAVPMHPHRRRKPLRGRRGVYTDLAAAEMRERNAFGNAHYISPGSAETHEYDRRATQGGSPSSAT